MNRLACNRIPQIVQPSKLAVLSRRQDIGNFSRPTSNDHAFNGTRPKISGDIFSQLRSVGIECPQMPKIRRVIRDKINTDFIDRKTEVRPQRGRGCVPQPTVPCTAEVASTG